MRVCARLCEANTKMDTVLINASKSREELRTAVGSKHMVVRATLTETHIQTQTNISKCDLRRNKVSINLSCIIPYVNLELIHHPVANDLVDLYDYKAIPLKCWMETQLLYVFAASGLLSGQIFYLHAYHRIYLPPLFFHFLTSPHFNFDICVYVGKRFFAPNLYSFFEEKA